MASNHDENAPFKVGDVVRLKGCTTKMTVVVARHEWIDTAWSNGNYSLNQAQMIPIGAVTAVPGVGEQVLRALPMVLLSLIVGLLALLIVT